MTACGHRCTKQDFPRVQLVDGREVCTWCEAWRHECEARAILKIYPIQKRREHLYGRFDKFGRIVGGILQIRGEAEVRRLETTMLALWRAKKQSAGLEKK